MIRGSISRTSLVALCVTIFLAGVVSTASAKTFDDAMSPVLANYLTIQKALAADSVDGVAQAAAAIASARAELDSAEASGENAEQLRSLPPKIETAARNLEKSSDLGSARDAFRNLSAPLSAWAVLSKPDGVVVAFCPMAGGSWVQPAGEITNPYFGKEMLHCGHVVGEDFRPCPHAGDGSNGCGQGGCGGQGGCPHQNQDKAPPCCSGATGT